jgi:PAS domain S-box-containing protein
VTGKDQPPAAAADDLRRRAEATARENAAASPPVGDFQSSPEATQLMLHELRVHQIELEMQNEELRRAQVELDAARARYFDLYDLAPVGYCTVSEPGLILEANLTAAALLGVARGALVNQPISRFILKEDQDIFYMLRKQVLETGEPQSCELRMVKQGGPQFWVRLSATAVQHEGGAPECRITLGDITERRQAEAERATLDVQLQQAQKMELVGRLAGGVAHNFNNMLGAILGYVELAIEQVDPTQPLYADLMEIRTAAEHSADLTRQLLAFARSQIIAPKVLDLNEIVATTVTMLARLIGEHTRLKWQPAAHLWPVKADRAQIEQSLVGLCVNARDAIGDVGTITVATGNRTCDDASRAALPGLVPGEYVWLAVSDDGCGMDKETLAHVFEPFFTTKGVGRGTGMGLATAYGAIKQNDGFVYVDSEPGQGTTVTIYLPRHGGRIEPARTTNDAAELLAPGRETILLVEDEPAILELTTKLLEKEGYTVLAAGTADNAIRLAREHSCPIHLLLTDVVMPEMNGRDLATRVAALQPGVKSLFMSGYTADIIEQRGVTEGDTHFIQKPFSAKGLAAKVRQALDGGRG